MSILVMREVLLAGSSDTSAAGDGPGLAAGSGSMIPPAPLSAQLQWIGAVHEKARWPPSL